MGRAGTDKFKEETITQEMIDRINRLAAKKRSEGLTEEEKAEQQELYGKYIAAFRRNLKAQLDMIKTTDETASKKN